MRSGGDRCGAGPLVGGDRCEAGGVAVRPPRLAERRPEAGFFWIRYWPTGWPCADADWVHLGTGHLGQPPAAESRATREWGGPLDDVVYLPPVSAEARDRQSGSVKELASRGAVPMVQRIVGDKASLGGRVEGVIEVYDPLAALLRTDRQWPESVAAGGHVVWPLIPALTDDPELWTDCFGRLAARGVRSVQAMTVQLSPPQRRLLAERFGNLKSSAFEALFHGTPAAERELARVAAQFGLAPFLERPVALGESRLVRNRRISGVLVTIGELWLRLGRPDRTGHEFFRSARYIEACGFDVEALARERNLGVLEAVDERSRELIEELVECGRNGLLVELEREYLGGEGVLGEWNRQ